MSPAVPAVTRAATGAGHWAAGRRQRALAAWAGAAGSGLNAWGLGTDGPFALDRTHEFKPNGAGCTVSFSFDMRPKAAMRLAFPPP